MGSTVTIVPPGRLAVGLQLPVQSQSTLYAEGWEAAAGPDEMAQVALAAEDAGFFYVAVCDHTVIPRRLAKAMSTTWYDTVATLGWLAGITSRVRLVSHVYIAALRHPLRAAKEMATLDVLSRGRLVVGIGAGHVSEEFDLLGGPGSFDQRGALTDEALAGIVAGLTEEFPELPGPRWVASDVGISPRPVQSPRPALWVGGSSPAALRRVARFADGWLTQTVKLDDFTRQLSQLRRMCEELRPGQAFDIGALPGAFYLGEPSWDVGRHCMSGSAERIADHLAHYGELGCSHLQVRFRSRSVDELCEQIGLFGEEVLPGLRRA